MAILIGFNHVSVAVSNLDKALAFYRDLLGMTLIREVPPGPPAPNPDFERVFNCPGLQMKNCLLRAGGPMNPIALELTYWENPKSGPIPDQKPWQLGFHSLCLRVDDVDALYQKLSAAGVPFLTPPVTSTPPRPPWRAVFCNDPDGNVVELLQTF
ncbi:MAG: VOC family protein [Chloroflexi bacterium]|nr:VOC family protein [Chloroflexota bacterium]